MPVVGQIPDASLSAPDLPSGDVDASLSAPDMPSGDVDASVSVPDIPSVDVKAPKKSLFGKFLKKKPSKTGVDVSDERGCSRGLRSAYSSSWTCLRADCMHSQGSLVRVLAQRHSSVAYSGSRGDSRFLFAIGDLNIVFFRPFGYLGAFFSQSVSIHLFATAVTYLVLYIYPGIFFYRHFYFPA